MAGDEVVVSTEQTTVIPEADFIVSHSYRHILKQPIIDAFENRIVNLHISLLPWNRGADPNFWSWFDKTPKGVSLCRIDAGVDTGDLILQKEVKFDPAQTLRSTYTALQKQAVTLFKAAWPTLRINRMPSYGQSGKGSSHKSADKEPYWALLPNGYDTPVDAVERMGEEVRAEQALSDGFHDKYMAEILEIRGEK